MNVKFNLAICDFYVVRYYSSHSSTIIIKVNFAITSYIALGRIRHDATMLRKMYTTDHHTNVIVN